MNGTVLLTFSTGVGHNSCAIESVTEESCTVEVDWCLSSDALLVHYDAKRDL